LRRLPQEAPCQVSRCARDFKCQSDGGPGIADILKPLRASEEPLSDQRSFLQANIVFRLVGAGDGRKTPASFVVSLKLCVGMPKATDNRTDIGRGELC